MLSIGIECLRPNRPEELFKELCEECGISSSWFRSPIKKRCKGTSKKRTTRCYTWIVNGFAIDSYCEKSHLAQYFLRRKSEEGLVSYGKW